jgi:hypothetical protein
MAATIQFLAGGYGFPINNLNNSGLGFFGSAGFGNSVAVNAYQGSTYITDGAGVNQGPEVNNTQWTHPNSGTVQTGTNLNLQNIPNYQSTLNIRFQNSTAVRTQNAKLYIYDRSSLSNSPSGVLCAVAQVIHPGLTQVVGGSGDSAWQFPAGSSYLPSSQFFNGVPFSPGTSGLSINGGATTDIQHDFYYNISASPTSVGSKTQFGLWWQTEYL